MVLKTDSASCFAAGETLQLESGDLINIEDAQVGDRILTASSSTSGQVSYAPIVSIPHSKNDILASLVRLGTLSGKSISMVQDHLLFAGTCGSELTLQLAGGVKEGDCVRTVQGEDEVVSVERHLGRGVYTVVTTEEYVVVSGVVASPFAITHTPCHLFYHIHRFLYSMAPSILKSSFFQQLHGRFGEMITSTALRF